MTTNKSDFYLKDIDLCKSLFSIMERKKIREDGYLTYREGDTTGAPVDMYPHAWLFSIHPTWRKDSLEAALVNYSYIIRTGFPTVKKFLFEDLPGVDRQYLIGIIRSYKNGDLQESLKALAQLIILLDKEGVE